MNRKQLLGRFATDKNITIETKYGKEYLACVESTFNPKTGVKCTGKAFFSNELTIHEYRFRTTSSGWIVPTNKSNYAEVTKEKTFGELDTDVMYCRDCPDTYYPSKTFKTTLDNPHLEEVMLKFIELNPDIVPFADGFKNFVDFTAKMLEVIHIDIHDDVVLDARMEKIVNDIKQHRNEIFASLYPYVKVVYAQEDKSEYYKVLKKVCCSVKNKI